jgi:6-pyruvoyl-tetrahydropterin synthase
MTDFYPSVERELDVGHDRVERLPTCQYDGHGHHLRVCVTARGLFDPARGVSYRVDDLDASLEAIVRELHGKSLNKMMPGSAPTPDGLALWIMERMSVEHPKIVEVTVWLDPQHRFSVKREPR